MVQQSDLGGDMPELILTLLATLMLTYHKNHLELLGLRRN